MTLAEQYPGTIDKDGRTRSTSQFNKLPISEGTALLSHKCLGTLLFLTLERTVCMRNFTYRAKMSDRALIRYPINKSVSDQFSRYFIGMPDQTVITM